jgi:hypothetical protein
MHCIRHCFICRPSDSTVSEDAGIEPRKVATTALAVRRSNHSAKSHPQILALASMFFVFFGEHVAPIPRASASPPPPPHV